jgi:predicted GNAT family N-acyltransferase
MNIPDYRIEPADFHVDREDLQSVRNAVFDMEQAFSTNEQGDEFDADSFHVVARDNQHRPIGSGRLKQDYEIDQLGVVSSWRQQGVGKSLLAALIDQASKLGLKAVKVNAHPNSILFYEKFNFVQDGEIIFKGGIAHHTMRLKLEPVIPDARPIAKARKPSVDAATFNRMEQTLAATLTIISEARRLLCIYSRDLEYNLYGHPEVVAALKQFAIQSLESSVQIIVQDTSMLRSQGHPLLELAQRLPSSFQIRLPEEPEDLQYPSAFIVNDRDGYLFRQFGNRHEGHWSPALPGYNRQLTEEFDRFWQRFTPCIEFRALSL